MPPFLNTLFFFFFFCKRDLQVLTASLSVVFYLSQCLWLMPHNSELASQRLKICSNTASRVSPPLGTGNNVWRAEQRCLPTKVSYSLSFLACQGILVIAVTYYLLHSSSVSNQPPCLRHLHTDLSWQLQFLHIFMDHKCQWRPGNLWGPFLYGYRGSTPSNQRNGPRSIAMGLRWGSFQGLGNHTRHPK